MKTDVLDIRVAELKMHEEVLYRHTEVYLYIIKVSECNIIIIIIVY